MAEPKTTLVQTLQYYGPRKNNPMNPAVGKIHAVSDWSGGRCTQHFINGAVLPTQPNTQEIHAIHDNGQVETIDHNRFTPLPGSIYKLTVHDSERSEFAKTYKKGSQKVGFILFLGDDSPVRSHELSDLLYPTLRKLAQRSEQAQPITPPQHTPTTLQPEAVIN